jgi:hypothetical protein
MSATLRACVLGVNRERCHRGCCTSPGRSPVA